MSLRQSLLEEKEKKGFISIRRLEKLVTLDSVREYLSNTLHKYPEPNLQLLCQKIIPKARKLLAVLVLAKLESSIIDFTDVRGITDSIFPVHDSVIPLPLENTEDIHSFLEEQWTVPPILMEDKHMEFPKGAKLPILKQGFIGHGSSGIVYKVRVVEGHLHGTRSGYSETSDFALKRIEVDGENYDSIMQEVAALRRRIHRNIIPLLASYTQLAIESSFETKSINILFPYAEMTMEKWLYLHSPPALIACQSPSEQRRYLYTAMYDLVSALASLHREVDGLVTSHHDLKPKNILVLGNKLMLADLGMSKLIHIHRTGGSEVDGANGIGTSTYHPPEYYREDDWERDRKMAFGRAFDMWAMGCIMIQVAILIAWGWESRNVEKFRRDRGNFILKEINNGDTHKSRIDDSFVKSIPVVDALLTRLQESGRTILQGFLAVIIQMLHKNPLERIYSWEAELDLYQLLHPDESTEERLKKEASAVQAPPPGKDINGIDTPIHRAARRGNIIRAISMLGAGWPVELKDGTMRTPIELAEQNGHFLLKDILLRATTVRQDGWRSVLKDGIPTPVIHTRDYRGFRIIQDTPWQGSDTSHYQGRGKDPHSSPSNLELQQEPLNSHTEQNVKSTDLHSVAKMKGVESLCTLLKSISSDEELLQGDEFGLTPLHHASKNSVAHINLILKAAKDPKQLLLAKDIRGRTPLHMAMGGNQLVAADTMLRYFAERRQALLVEDNEGITPLKMALESGGTDWEKIFEIID